MAQSYTVQLVDWEKGNDKPLRCQRGCELCRDDHAGQTSTQRSERVTGACCLTTIVPALTLPEALETIYIHRVAGLTGVRTALVTTRPFRAPHHTLSDVGLIGGGQVPRPGDVSLAHHGGLFLDERPECTRHVLEVPRQPLENGII
jgi:Magnesium chelatase, subunit ChlI